jgi:hypothetical protein
LAVLIENLPESSEMLKSFVPSTTTAAPMIGLPAVSFTEPSMDCCAIAKPRKNWLSKNVSIVLFIVDLFDGLPGWERDCSISYYLYLFSII